MVGSVAGQVIDNKYELVGVVGRGGMSVVWLARDVRLQKMWAVKEVLPNGKGERGRVLRQAIVDEANFMKRLDHPAIPRVVDIVNTGETLYVVMDYVNGQPLSGILSQQRRPFMQEDVVAWGIELCDVLEYLHCFVTPEGEHHPIVYRDMKPANVMLRDDNHVRLVDFGVCWERTGEKPNDAMVVGTPGYASPEQMMLDSKSLKLRADALIDERCDVYGLGTTLYSLASGHVPKIITDERGVQGVLFDMRPLREWDPKLSEGLERIVAKSTKADPNERYQSMAEMRYDLEHYEQLTHEYRVAQRRKVAQFKRKLMGMAACFACALALVTASFLVRDTSYASYMREASVAPAEPGPNGGPSKAEALYTKAIEADPSHIEPYERLMAEVYERDNVFTREEEQRWNDLFRAHESVLVANDSYARLCFNAGVCYLCLYGVDADSQQASAVGQSAIVQAGNARVWFQRVERACGIDESSNSIGSLAQATQHKGSQNIEDADLLASHVYLQIAEFNDLKQRAAREGRAAGEVYQNFWVALCHAVDASASCTEGVRLRLLQIAFQAIAADDVLDGVYRKALEDGRVEESRAEVEALLDVVLQQVRSDSLTRFCESPATRATFGPIYNQITNNEEIARNNIAFVYGNPVARIGAIAGTEREEEEAWN